MLPQPPRSTLFPYTTLVRSNPVRRDKGARRNVALAVVHVTATVDLAQRKGPVFLADRKSTRLNSSHGSISYAVFCLKKKNKIQNTREHTSDIDEGHATY